MHFLWKMNFVWKMILIHLPAEKAYYIWAPIQYPSCAFCVENDFESTITWGIILHLSTQATPLVCILYEEWFWINDQLRNHVTFEHQIKSQYLSLSPSSSFTSGVSRSSLLSSPREFGSCKLCGKDFSIDSWLKMHIISKHQTDSQDLSLSFFLVHIWSLFSIRPLRHLQGVWIGDLCEET